MQVSIPYNPEVAEPIGAALTSWVQAEAIASMSGNNACLDDFEQVRAGMSLELTDTGNIDAAKYLSHSNRQKQNWGPAMTLQPDNDMAMGQHIFNQLMQLSGTARRICYFQAADESDYLERRKRPDVIGIDPVRAVSLGLERIRGSSGNFTLPDAEGLQVATMNQFGERGYNLEWLRSRVPTDFGREDTAATTVLQREQRQWARLTATSMLVAASYRGGDIAAVPALEPMSISDNPAIIYPFADAA